MVKHIIKFDLPEEKVELSEAIYGPKLRSIIYDFDQKMRQLQKYQDDEPIVPSKVRNVLREVMEAEGINFDNEIFD